MSRKYKYSINLCECREEDLRGKVGILYRRENNQVVCGKCGKIPPEISSSNRIPNTAHIELEIWHELDDTITRIYKEIIAPSGGDDNER